MSMATLREVAREAGVSIATVSNAMNNPSVVRPETREAVLAAARKLSYVPNVNGQRLRARETRSIGLFVGAMRGDYYAEMADSMFHACQKEGYDLQISMVNGSDAILRKLGSHMLDAAVIFYDAMEEWAQEQSMKMGCPLVFMGRERTGERVSCILHDAREQGRMAADYLTGLGKRRLMHIFGLQGNYDSEQRWLGFREELQAKGMDCETVGLLEGRFEREAAYRRMRTWIREGNPMPDGIFASNDLSAIGCLAALTEAGYRVPEDVSLMGCDDILLCGYTRPAMTTIRTHFENIGTAAARELLRLIGGETGKTIRLNSTLIVRHSCCLSED